MIHQARNYDATCVIVSGLAYHTVLPARNYDATCATVSGLVYQTVLPERAKLRQHSLLHQARNYATTRIIVSGLVSHIVLPELCQAPAAQHDTPGPKLRRNLRHSFVLGVS